MLNSHHNIMQRNCIHLMAKLLSQKLIRYNVFNLRIKQLLHEYNLIYIFVLIFFRIFMYLNIRTPTW